MGIKQMQGTSAYLEYVGPHGHKKRTSCAYYKKGICHNTHNQTNMSKCVGRLCCGCYKDKLSTDEKIQEYKNKSYKINHALINKTVTLFNITYNEWLKIVIVNDEDRDEINNKISIDSPLGKLLTKSKVGEIIEVNQGSINVRYRVKSIR